MAEEERYASFDKLKSEAEQLRSMGIEGAIEVVKGYHQMYLKTVAECLEQLQKITNLSPITLGLTKTAIIVAERDFIDKAKGETGMVAVLGSNDDVVDLLNQLWNATPDVFEELVKSRGYTKVEEKSA